mmetsp:Transcript_8622/g.12873  ORF Transcript_8622/g.12873 Transcript_8622/m.12873 type:complete len:224 (+) Transcript_8622:2-673(+)
MNSKTMLSFLFIFLASHVARSHKYVAEFKCKSPLSPKFSLNSICKFTSIVAATTFSLHSPTLAAEISSLNANIIGTVRVSNPNIIADGNFGEESAIYATVRQDLGVWTSAVRNIKAAPVLSKRIQIDSTVKSDNLFPYKVQIDATKDLTPEGIALSKEWQSGRTPLTISVRLDRDGIASTRDPQDLVGRGSVSRNSDGSWSEFDIELAGRGIVGKVLTTSKNR